MRISRFYDFYVSLLLPPLLPPLLQVVNGLLSLPWATFAVLLDASQADARQEISSFSPLILHHISAYMVEE